MLWKHHNHWDKSIFSSFDGLFAVEWGRRRFFRVSDGIAVCRVFRWLNSPAIHLSLAPSNVIVFPCELTVFTLWECWWKATSKRTFRKSRVIRTCLATDGTRLPFDEKGPAIMATDYFDLIKGAGRETWTTTDGFPSASAVGKFEYADQFNEVSVTGSGIRPANDIQPSGKKNERNKRKLLVYLEDDWREDILRP